MVRRTERALIREYRAAVTTCLPQLGPATQRQVAALAALPELVRGYEGIKLESIVRYREALDRALRELGVEG